MIRTDMDEVSDEEFFRVVAPCEEMVTNYVKDNFLNQYIAFHIAVYFRGNAMWQQSFSNQVSTAIDDLSQFTNADCDFELVKKILEETYELKITSESPLKIEDIIKQ